MQNTHLKSVLGYGFGASNGVSCVLYDGSTDKVSVLLCIYMHRLVCQWWGETISTYLKAAWNPWVKALNMRQVPGKFYRLACCIFPQLVDSIKFNFEVEWNIVLFQMNLCLLK